MQKKLGIVWLQNDLRLDDNPLIELAALECERLLFVYILDPISFKPNRYGLLSVGTHRHAFLRESLSVMDANLQRLNQKLMIFNQSPLIAFSELLRQYPIEVIYSSENAGFYEQSYQKLLARRYPFIEHKIVNNNTLFEQRQLPFKLTELPESFSKFRRKIESVELRQAIRPPTQTIRRLPPPPKFVLANSSDANQWLVTPTLSSRSPFSGGEDTALQHLQNYLKSGAAHEYKKTRNALDSWSASTKLSPWLADGSLSVRRVQHELLRYEQSHGANESTYWIFFELLWREYFQWYAHKYGRQLFSFAGLKDHPPKTSFYAARWQQWCSGTTPYPIVNACMNQLNATGYMSNRGRQLVASCFVHELELDWRYGAAFFEQQLIDYDVASNWGNWQYLAGVGADPRGHRRFDLTKQTQQYDPQGEFIALWNGDVASQPDWIDAADWPMHS